MGVTVEHPHAAPPKINELGLGAGLGGSTAYKLYGINQINVYTNTAYEGDEYQVKMEKLFKYIEERVGRPITIEPLHEYHVYKFYSVKW